MMASYPVELHRTRFIRMLRKYLKGKKTIDIMRDNASDCFVVEFRGEKIKIYAEEWQWMIH